MVISGVRPGTAPAGGFELVVRENLERKLEFLVQLVLPLLAEGARADDQAAAQVASSHQLLDEEPGHDRLAGARIVGEEEAERLALQHLLVDGDDLVRERIDEAGVWTAPSPRVLKQCSPTIQRI